MFDVSQFLDGVNDEAPELLEAATTLRDFAVVFNEAEVAYDDDGVACLSVDFSLPYPDDEVPKCDESWTAAVYGDEAEVWHLRAAKRGAKIITAQERMPLDEFVGVLSRLREQLLGGRA